VQRETQWFPIKTLGQDNAVGLSPGEISLVSCERYPKNTSRSALFSCRRPGDDVSLDMSVIEARKNKSYIPSCCACNPYCSPNRHARVSNLDRDLVSTTDHIYAHSRNHPFHSELYSKVARKHSRKLSKFGTARGLPLRL
jgi:hypothetical protein